MQRLRACTHTCKTFFLFLPHTIDAQQLTTQFLKANPDIDIMVGGHTNTFLYKGEPIQKEKPEGPYPEVIEV